MLWVVIRSAHKVLLMSAHDLFLWRNKKNINIFVEKNIQCSILAGKDFRVHLATSSSEGFC